MKKDRSIKDVNQIRQGDGGYKQNKILLQYLIIKNKKIKTKIKKMASTKLILISMSTDTMGTG